MRCSHGVRGDVVDLARDAAAFPLVHGNNRNPAAPMFGTVINAAWSTPDDAERNVAWAQATGQAIRALGAERLYSNQMMADEQERIRDAYGDNYQRLLKIKE